MSVQLDEITSKAMELSETERIDLVCALLSSLEEKKEAEVHQAWKTEIAKRVEEIHRGSVQGKPACRCSRKFGHPN